MKMTLIEFDTQFTELLDKALNELSPKNFAKFVNDINFILAGYDDDNEADN